MMSDIAEIYDIDDMSDKERFILLMGFIDYDSILPVIQFVKSAFESRAVLYRRIHMRLYSVFLWLFLLSYTGAFTCACILFFYGSFFLSSFFLLSTI